MDVRGGRAHAEEWINGVFNNNNMPQVSQCLNDIERMAAWDGPAVSGIVTAISVTDGDNISHRLYHVSAGKAGTRNKTCTLFFVADPVWNAANVIGVYQHTGPTTYARCWAQQGYAMPGSITL